MHDLVIRGGTVVDGTGAPRRIADVAVDAGIITAVGSGLATGRREVDAKGLLVTPGFVDVHTHYDGQATWDSYLTPSAWHGVTTAVFGNCGVGFAPVRRKDVPYLINLMQGVEDIPEVVLTEGVSFEWESFPQYLDYLDKMPRVIDIATQVPHTALRFYVMGERGADHTATPHAHEIDTMGQLLEQALAAGALGFSTSRTFRHRSADGRYSPTFTAGSDELMGLAAAMKRAGRGVIQANSDFGTGEYEALEAMARLSGRPLSFLVAQMSTAPGRWRELLELVHQSRREQLAVTAQVSCRPIGVLMGLETTMNPFRAQPAWLRMEHLSPRQRFERLSADAALREDLVNSAQPDPLMERVLSQLPRACVTQGIDYEPDPTQTLAHLAQASGRSVREIALDVMMSEDGKGLLLLPYENYHDGNLDAVHEMMADDASILGLSDAGAHLGVICDASAPTLLLTHWTRDRTRGPKFALEWAVHKQTQVGAAAMGLSDRGALVPGLKADINVIDYDALTLLRPEVVYDLPAGGRRLIQRAKGYRHVFVRGVEVVADDEFTGQMPGQLIRG